MVRHGNINPYLDVLYAKGEAFVRKHIALKKSISPLNSDASLPAQPVAITAEEQAINRSLTTTVLVLAGNTAAAIFYPPLMWLSVPVLLKKLLSIAQKAYSDLTQKRKVGVSAMIVMGKTSLLLLQQFWLSAFFDTLYMCSTKFLSRD